MALVKAPFFSLWASGSFGKTLTVRALFQDNKFTMARYKRFSGKRHEIQIYNSEVLKNRMKATRETWKDNKFMAICGASALLESWQYGMMVSVSIENREFLLELFKIYHTDSAIRKVIINKM